MKNPDKPWSSQMEEMSMVKYGKVPHTGNPVPMHLGYTKFFTHICVYWPRSSPNPQFL